MLRLIGLTILAIIAVLAAFTVVAVLANAILAALISGLGLPDWTGDMAPFLVLLMFWFLPWKSYINRSVTLSAQIDIDAPRDVVWTALLPRPTTHQFRRFYREIKAVEGTTDQFLFVPKETAADPHVAPKDMVLKLTAVDAPNALTLYHANAEDQGGLRLGASLETFALEDLPDGGTRVSNVEVLDRMSLWLGVTMLFVNPLRDQLTSLKHFCEGTPDTSFMARHMDALDTSGRTELQRNVAVMSVVACLILTLIAFGLISLAFSAPHS